MPRFEVEAVFTVNAPDRDTAWRIVYDALMTADDAKEGRTEGNLPMWEILDDAGHRGAR